MRFRPCIDLRNGLVTQIVGGSLSSSNSSSSNSSDTATTNFTTELSSSHFAEMYRRDGLVGGHVIMLGPGNETAALNALRAYPKGLQLGGGINLDNALHYLDAGASHVIVTSFVFSGGKIDMERLQSLVDLVGKERLVLDMSCRKKEGKYYVVTDRWQKYTEMQVCKETIELLEGYCNELLVHGVDVEGLRTGMDLELIDLLAECVTIPTTYAGGAQRLEDLNTVKERGKGKIDLTIGSALDIFGGDVSYAKVVEWDKQQQK